MAGLTSVLLVAVLCCVPSRTGASKVLMMGPSGSHWLNLVYLAEGLISNGHEVVSLVPSNMYVNQRKMLNTPVRQKIRLERYQVVEEEDVFDKFMQMQVEFAFGDTEEFSFFEFVKLVYKGVRKITTKGFGTAECQELLQNHELVTKLRQTEFDIVIIDPAIVCGVIVARLLDVPLVSMSAPFLQPFLLSYSTQVPIPVATYYDHRTGFHQRVKNLAIHAAMFLMAHLMMPMFTAFDPIASRALGYDVTVMELFAETDLHLMREDSIIHPPHPLMPNMVQIGGYNVQTVNPLPKDVEEFVETSGEKGVVIVSFGSYTKVISNKRAEMLAAGLARVPYKVVWKFDGQRPKIVGNNTMLLDWIPQNDLLANKETRVFVTHCGINAVYEAMFHGVPMVRVPAFAEQGMNSALLETLGTGVTLDIFTMTSDDLYTAILEVAENKTYKANAARLANIQRDQQQSPMDRAVWWIEHVIRHGGLPHLKSAARHLNPLQYFLLDVVVLLLAIMLLWCLLLWLSCRCCCRIVFGKKPPPKEKKQ